MEYASPEIGKKKVSLAFVTILLLSSLLNVATSEVDLGAELATAGDLLLLDSEGEIISVDLQTLVETSDLEQATKSTSRLEKQDSLATGLAHDDTNLYVSFADGTLEAYDNVYASGSNSQWSRTSTVMLNPPASSLTIAGQGLAWTSTDDASIRLIPRSDLEAQPIVRENLQTDVGLNGLTSLVATDLTGQREAYMALDSKGETVLGTSPLLPTSAGLASERMWVRAAEGVDGGPSPAVQAIGQISINESGDIGTKYIVIDSDGIRFMQRESAMHVAHYFTQTVPANYNSATAPFAFTKIENGTLESHSIIKMSRSDAIWKSRCSLTTLTFAEVAPFTYLEGGKEVQGGTITLSLGGMERQFEWGEISGRTVQWNPPAFPGSPQLCMKGPAEMDLRIVNSSDNTMTAEIILASPSITPSGTGSSPDWKRSMMVEHHTTSTSSSVRATLATPTFGSDVVTPAKLGLGEIQNGPLGDLFESNYISDLSINQPDDLKLMSGTNSGTSVTLNSTRMVQSVWEPKQYTQAKSVWWEVEIGSDYTDGTEIDVQLLVRGVDCSLGTELVPPSLVAVPIDEVGSTTVYSPVLKEMDCHSELRWADTWLPTPSEVKPPRSDVCNFEDDYFVRLFVLNYTFVVGEYTGEWSNYAGAEEFAGGTRAVIPADSEMVEGALHEDAWIRPAKSNTECFISNPHQTLHPVAFEEGQFFSKVIIDPEGKLFDKNTSDNSGKIVISNSVPTGLDNGKFTVAVIPVDFKFHRCLKWSWMGLGKKCVDRADGYTPHHVDCPDATGMGLTPDEAWADCWYGRDWHDGPSDSDAEEVVEKITQKMQEMWPIPNGELEVTLFPRETFDYYQKKMPLFAALPLVSQRTVSYFELINEYHTWCEVTPSWDCPDRVVVLVDEEVGGSNGPLMHRPGGFVENSGMTPCSRSSVINTHGTKNMADTAIHEMGHGVLVGHDNFAVMDHTINNCGLDSLYRPGERATGWNPDGTDSVGLSQGQYMDGESFMRYSHDGEKWIVRPCNDEERSEGCFGNQMSWTKYYSKWKTENRDADRFQECPRVSSENVELFCGDGNYSIHIDTPCSVCEVPHSETKKMANNRGGVYLINEDGYAGCSWISPCVSSKSGNQVDDDFDYHLNWIQNVDYEYLQEGMWYNSCQYMDKYGSLALESVDQYWGDVKPYLVDSLRDALGSIFEPWYAGLLLLILAPILILLIPLAAYSFYLTATSMLNSIFSPEMDCEGSSATGSDSTGGRNGMTDGSFENSSMIFGGALTSDGTYLGGDVYPMLSTSPIALDNYSVVEGYTIQLLDTLGATLSEHEMYEPDGLRDEYPDTIMLSASVPYSGAERSWKIVDADGSMVAEGIISSLDGVSFDSNLSIETETDQIIASWTAQESGDGSFIEYDVYESFNGGGHWRKIANNQIENEITIHASSLRTTSSYSLRVVASDGFITTESISSSVEIMTMRAELYGQSSQIAAPGEEVLALVQFFDTTSNCIVKAPLNWAGVMASEVADELYEGMDLTLVPLIVPDGAFNGDSKIDIVVNCADGTDLSVEVELEIRGGMEPPAPEAEEAHSHSHELTGFVFSSDMNETDFIPPILLDSDADGIRDAFDECPTTSENAVAESNGCAVVSTESSDDGVPIDPESTSFSSMSILVLSIFILWLMSVAAVATRKKEEAT